MNDGWITGFDHPDIEWAIDHIRLDQQNLIVKFPARIKPPQAIGRRRVKGEVRIQFLSPQLAAQLNRNDHQQGDPSNPGNPPRKAMRVHIGDPIPQDNPDERPYENDRQEAEDDRKYEDIAHETLPSASCWDRTTATAPVDLFLFLRGSLLIDEGSRSTR